MTEPAKKEVQFRSIPVSSEERLIEAWEKNQFGSGYNLVTFPASSVERIKKITEKGSAIVLLSGAKISVALTYEELKQKVYRPDFKADEMSGLDLRSVTGVSAGWLEPTDAGKIMEDGTIYLGFYKDRDWYVTDKDAPLRMNFNKAAEYARYLHQHGYSDWLVPDAEILTHMFNNKSSGNFAGSYGESYYWTSKADGDEINRGWQVSFKHGSTGAYNDSVQVRCVRSEPRP
jgi:hypothetical protein